MVYGGQSPIWAVAFSEDGRQLAAAGADSLIRVWDVENDWQLLSVLEGHSATVTAIRYIPNGRLISVSVDRIIRLWNPFPGHLIGKLPAYAEDSVCSVHYDQTRNQVVTGCQDGSVGFWELGMLAIGFNRDIGLFDLKEGTQQNLKGHTASVLGFSFSRTEPTLASAGQDRKIMLWDTASGDHRFTFYGHGGWVTAIAFSPDGSRLASAGGFDWTVRWWDAPHNVH